MATIAAGKQNGIAPKADLFLLKTKGQWNRPDSTSQPAVTEKNYAVQPLALLKALNTIRLDVETRLEEDKTAKSVVNLSSGMSALLHYYHRLC